MMKRIRGVMAVVLCVAMCTCACSSQSSADKPEEPAASDSEDVKKETKEEKEYQKKLDMIQPSAYDNVMGLKLEKGSTFSVIGKAKDVPYWDEVKRGAEQAVEDINENLGYEGKDRVKMTYSAPGTPDNVDEQVNILDEELARYPVALGIAIADVNACEVQFDLAAESDIPVVAFDSGSAYQGLMAMVSTDNQASAREAAGRLAELIDDTGEVILFIHDSKSESALNRESAFREEIEKNHPDISIAEVYYMDQLSDMQKTVAAEKNGDISEVEDGTEDDAEGDKRADDEDTETGETRAEDNEDNENNKDNENDENNEKNKNNENKGTETVQGDMTNEGEGTLADEITEEEVIDHLLAKHPDVKGFYAANGDAVKLAVSALERNEIDVPIIGYDADEEEIEALAEGKVDALVLQNPFGMGYATIIAAARAALSMGNEAVVDTGYTWLTQKNLEEDSIQKLMY